MNTAEQGKKTRDRMLQAIIGYIKQNGYPPSNREIGEMAGIKSNATVHYQLLKMEKEGMIKLGEYASPRAIKVVGYEFVKEGNHGQNENKGSMHD